MKVSRKSVWMIALSLLVSAALIITVVLYAVGASKNEPVQSAEMWFIISMIVIAVLTFGLFAWRRLHKSKYVKKLNAQFFEAYEKFSDALGGAKLSKAEVRETKQDVLSLLLEAQQSGRSADEVTGPDIGEFAERVQSSFGYRSSFWFELGSVVQYGIFFVVFIQVLLYFSELCVVPFFECALGLSLVIMFAPIIFVIYPLLKSAMRSEKRMFLMFLPILYGVAYIALVILLDNVFGDLAWVRYVLDTQVVMISSLWQLIAMVVVFAGVQALKWCMRRRSLRKLSLSE